jgi:prevent-host-death family protein
MDLVYSRSVAKKTVNIHEAKTHLSRLLSRVEQGEEIVIARSGRPIARLLPFSTKSTKRVLGGARGQVWIAEDFDAPLPDDVLADFEQ